MNRALLLLTAAGRRVVSGLLLLIGASFVIYVTVRSAPGDAIDAITPMGTTQDVKEKLAEEFGLDRDPLTGYLAWLGRSVQGDFGESLVFSPGEKVITIALPAFKKTLSLAGLALGGALALGLLMAMLLGVPSGRQQVLTGPLYMATAAPSFVVAILMAEGLNWSIQRFVESAGQPTPPWYPIPIYTESSMPYIFAGISLIAGDGLFMDLLNSIRAELLTLRRSQFIAAVKAKGARTFGHLARNLIVPITSGYAARLPIVLGSVVIVEYIFTLDGAGYLLLEASRSRDFPIVVGLSVYFTATVIIANLAADLIRAIMDPREVARGG